MGSYLGDSQQLIYRTFDQLGIARLEQFQRLNAAERQLFSHDVISKITDVRRTPNDLLNTNHVNLRFPRSLLGPSGSGTAQFWNLLHRNAALYADHSIICIKPMRTQERRNVHDYVADPEPLDSATVQLFLEHRPLIQHGKMSIVPEFLEISLQNRKRVRPFAAKQLGAFAVQTGDIYSFFLRNKEQLTQQGFLLLRMPQTDGIPLDGILEIVRDRFPDEYKSFQHYLKDILETKIQPGDFASSLAGALKRVDEQIEQLDAEYHRHQKKLYSKLSYTGGAAVLAIALYGADAEIANYVGAAFASLAVTYGVEYIPATAGIPERIRAHPFFVPWYVRKAGLL